MLSKIVFIIEKTDTGFSAYASNFKKYPVGTTGSTIADLKANLLDATNFLLEDRKKSVSADQLVMRYDLSQFFQYYKEINAKAVASRVGINPTLLSQYVNGKKKPSDQQIKKILIGIQELGRELSTLELV